MVDPSLTELPLGLDGSLFRSPMPFGPYDAAEQLWPAYQDENIDLVVVLTEPQEYLVYTGGDLPVFYRQSGLEVITLPIRDFATPSEPDSFDETLNQIENALREGRNVAVHCLAGLGRTGIVAACLAARVLDLSGLDAIRWVREHVPGALQSTRQENFVINVCR